MTTISSMAETKSRGNPDPSLPMKTAAGPRKSTSCKTLPLCDDVANSLTPAALSWGRISATLMRANGSRNNDPAEARTTFGLKGLTEFSPMIIPPPPKASAERMIVPRLPGSWIPTTPTSIPACILRMMSSGECSFRRTKAATPWGESLGTALENSLSGSNRVSACAPICGSSRAALFSADSLKNTASSRTPLRIASSTIRKPSTAHTPERAPSPRENAARNSLTKELCFPSICRSRSCAILFIVELQSADQNDTLLPTRCRDSHDMLGFAVFRAGREGSTGAR